jgi:hypothetical protein
VVTARKTIVWQLAQLAQMRHRMAHLRQLISYETYAR